MQGTKHLRSAVIGLIALCLGLTLYAAGPTAAAAWDGNGSGEATWALEQVGNTGWFTPGGSWQESIDVYGWCAKFTANACGAESAEVIDANALKTEMANAGRMNYTAATNAPVGALVFYNLSSWGHVGIHVGGGFVVHAGYSEWVRKDYYNTLSNYIGWAYPPPDRWPGRADTNPELGVGWWGPWAGAPVLACEDTSLWTRVTPPENVGSVWYEGTWFGSSHGLGQASHAGGEDWRMTWWPPLNTSLRVNLRVVAYNKSSQPFVSDYPRYITEELYTVAGDFTGDGYDDIVRLSADGNATELWLLASDGQYFAAQQAGRLEDWGRLYTKAQAGDVDGDGTDELLLFVSGAGDASGDACALHVFEYANGKFTGKKVWSVASGWAWERVKPAVGDVDGDGRDELVALYDYDGWNGWDTSLWVWDVSGASATATATNAWIETNDGWYDWNSCNLFCGDFDGDGIDEVSSFYRYGDHDTGWIIFERDPSNGTYSWSRPWRTTSGWEFGSGKPAVGDFDGDGKDEVANLYNYDGFNGWSSGLILTDLDGTTTAFSRVWTVPTGAWDWVRTRLLAGDFEGDGLDEIASMYDYHWNAETSEKWAVHMWSPRWSWADKKVWDKASGVWSETAPTATTQPFADAVLRPPSTQVSVVGVAGSTRYETAIEASKRAYPSGASTVVIATGANWPDALGGAALAGVVDGPLLLTTQNALPDTVLAEVERLGATDAYILGGTGAVGSAVQSRLQSELSGEIVRIAGANRYATANRIADEVIAIAQSQSGFQGDALIATGANFPDALGASPLAASSGMPILLAPPNGTPYLPDAVDSAVILGGTGAVSATTEAAVKSELGSIVRVGGANRYDTAAKIAEYGISLGMHWDGVGIATGAAFPDALSGGAMLGSFNSVLLLTRSTALVPSAEQCLSDNKQAIRSIYFVGGTGAVGQSVRDKVEQVLE